MNITPIRNYTPNFRAKLSQETMQYLNQDNHYATQSGRQEARIFAKELNQVIENTPSLQQFSGPNDTISLSTSSKSGWLIDQHIDIYLSTKIKGRNATTKLDWTWCPKNNYREGKDKLYYLVSDEDTSKETQSIIIDKIKSLKINADQVKSELAKNYIESLPKEEQQEFYLGIYNALVD